MYKGALNVKATLDLIIVDIHEDLALPFVSALVDVVPPWNMFEKSFLELVFVFVKDYL